MAGWSRNKRLEVEQAFYAYLDRCMVNSKDDGWISLGKNIYEGQRSVITKIFDALEADTVLSAAIGQEMIDNFIAIKREEVRIIGAASAGASVNLLTHGERMIAGYLVTIAVYVILWTISEARVE